jgi:hypothetical protein
MIAIRYILGSLLILFFAGCALSNASVVWNYFRKGATGSMIPLLGGIAGAASGFVFSLSQRQWFWWIPLVLDTGSVAWLILGCTSILRRE